MAITKLNPMFETSSGSLQKPTKKSGHSHGKYLLTTHRRAASENPNCQRAYTGDAARYARTTPVTAREMQARTRFTAVRQAVWDRAHDLNKISADQAAFLAQKDTPGGKRTMNAYLWKLEGEAYDANH